LLKHTFLLGLLKKNFPEKTSVFPAPLGLVIIKITRPKQKKEKLGQFSAQREALDKSLTGF
jgi:hypothetical protein